MKFCKFIDCETEHRPGSQIMVGAESFRPNLDSNFVFFFFFFSCLLISTIMVGYECIRVVRLILGNDGM